mmetsp:Transcript_29625/g.67058  ORF Transcript_29625/g.67058 Transcript_29625/m.67058 type:complete len:233 (-) Transcript_29625:861-1559(-)|eukprot:766618-Hanusia_phi.AAC.3
MKDPLAHFSSTNTAKSLKYLRARLDPKELAEGSDDSDGRDLKQKLELAEFNCESNKIIPAVQVQLSRGLREHRSPRCLRFCDEANASPPAHSEMKRIMAKRSRRGSQESIRSENENEGNQLSPAAQSTNHVLSLFDAIAGGAVESWNASPIASMLSPMSDNSPSKMEEKFDIALKIRSSKGSGQDRSSPTRRSSSPSISTADEEQRAKTLVQLNSPKQFGALLTAFPKEWSF